MLSSISRFPNANLDYLQAELTRIDVLIRRFVQEYTLQRQAHVEQMGGNVALFETGASALLNLPLGSNWGPSIDDVLPVDEGWDALYAQAVQQSLDVAALEEQAGASPRLTRLASIFALDHFEIDILLLALLPSLDPRYSALFAQISDEPLLRYPSVNLILNILRAPGLQRLQSLPYFAADAPLFRAQLLQWHSEPTPGSAPLVSQTLTVDPAITSWLLGNYQIPTLLRSSLECTVSHGETADALLAAETLPRLLAALQNQSIIYLYGHDQVAALAAASQFAHRKQLSLLSLHVENSMQAELSPPMVLRLALREATLTGAMLQIVGIDPWLQEGRLPKVLLAELKNYASQVIITGKVQWQLPNSLGMPTVLWLDVPMPSRSQRQALWEYYLADQPEIADFSLEVLAGFFELDGLQIRMVVNKANDSAAMRGDSLQVKDLFAIARSHANAHLDFLANKISPRYGWSDLVVPQQQLVLLQEIVAVVRGRNQVLEEWGVGAKLVSSPAVTMLFVGEPGTGKTMAAEVIAKDLELDLYKIDLSSLVSKYIGETEKNLEHIFTEAERSQAILFFDEADAIFGKRTGIQDSHDRYANAGVSYLLQRMEAYSGITILATNLRANLDEAFIRRIHFIVDFPFPDADDRLRIWEALWPQGVPTEPDVDFRYLAQRLKLAGGNIRNILVLACYLAASEGVSVNLRHLQHASRRELQKMGRIVQEADLQEPTKRESVPVEAPTSSRMYPTRPRK